MALAVALVVVALPHRATAGATPASLRQAFISPACSLPRCGSVVALQHHRPASAHSGAPASAHSRAAGPAMNAYDDYAAEIKDKLDSLDIQPVVPLVPERGNGGIGGRDRSKGKVRVMGAKLDADVAGTQALDAKFATEEHERLFQAGVKGMRKGEYRAATTAFTQAIAAYPGGMTSRKGGEYAVWLAQALHARGQTDEAKELLKSFEKHPDGDVRSVADSVLYIYQAPELKLGEENFMRINMDLATNDDWGRRRAPPKQLKDPPPEKYSVEWYVLRAKETERSKAAPDTKRAGGSVAALALLTAASAAAYVLF